MKQITNTGMKNWKKRKLMNNGFTERNPKLQNQVGNKYLTTIGNKKLKCNSEDDSDVKVKGHSAFYNDNPKMSDKPKELKCSKKRQARARKNASGVNSDSTDVPSITKNKVENGSTVETNESSTEIGEKAVNNSDKVIITLTKIERKGVCSNWKLFKQMSANDNSTGQVPKFRRKKPFNNIHRTERKKNNKEERNQNDEQIDFKKRTLALENENQNYSSSHTNGNLKQETNSTKPTHKLTETNENSSDILNKKQERRLEVKKVIKQDLTLAAPHTSKRLTKEIALDCEMVGTDDQSDMVARVSLVNKFGECVYDKYVAPTEKVHDYRTWVSGIRPENLKNAEDFKQVQKEVAELIKGRLLVGHALRNDLRVLFLSHPRKYTRDTQRFKLFRELAKTKRPSLKKLASTVLDVSIQEGEHSSVEDARVAMQLYMMYQKKWEKLFRKSRRKHDSNSLTSEDQ